MTPSRRRRRASAREAWAAPRAQAKEPLKHSSDPVECEVLAIRCHSIIPPCITPSSVDAPDLGEWLTPLGRNARLVRPPLFEMPHSRPREIYMNSFSLTAVGHLARNPELVAKGDMT